MVTFVLIYIFLGLVVGCVFWLDHEKIAPKMRLPVWVLTFVSIWPYLLYCYLYGMMLRRKGNG